LSVAFLPDMPAKKNMKNGILSGEQPRREKAKKATKYRQGMSNSATPWVEERKRRTRQQRVPMIRPGVYDDRYGAVDAAMKGVMALARTIAVPREFPALRVPSYPELKRTAVLPFTRTGNVSLTTQSTAVAVMRNPVYPAWMESVPTISTATSYWLQGDSPGAGGAPAYAMVLTPEYWTAQGGIGAVNDRVWPVGRDSTGRVWAYVPYSANNALSGYQPTVSISFAAAVSGAVLNMQLEHMTSVGKVTQVEYSTTAYSGSLQEVPLASTLGTTSLNGPSWFRVAEITYTNYSGSLDINTVKMGIATGAPSSSSLSAPATLSGTGMADVSMWPLAQPPEFYVSNEPYFKVRGTAVGLLLSNVTSVLNQEGSIRAVRIPTEDFDWSRQPYNSDRFKSANPVEVFAGKLAKGCYSYTLSDSQSEDFRNVVSDIAFSSVYSNNAKRVPAFLVDSFSYVNVIQLQDTNTTTITNLQYVLDNHIEFVTSSALFNLDHSRITLEDYHRAQMVLAEKGVFFENPVHLAAIASMIAGAVRAMYPVIKPLLYQAAVPVAKWAVGRGQKFIDENSP
jgi:hypothetical protein